MKEAGASVGVGSFAHGNVWEIVSGGQSFVCWKKNDETTIVEESLLSTDCNDFLILHVYE
jgi:hypothetical protein